jgi:hypothetical protein
MRAQEFIIESKFKLGTVLTWPELTNQVSSAMRAMGWSGKRRGDNDFIFTTQGPESQDQYYTVIIHHTGDGFFTYALGTVEDGDPYIGEKRSLPCTEASVSELMMAIRTGFGLGDQHMSEDRYTGEDLPELKQALDNWYNMKFTAQDIKTILEHPYSQPFKRPQGDYSELYRGLVVRGNQIKAVPKKGNRMFVAYATHRSGAEVFLGSINVSERRQVIVEKEFNPADFVLDFSRLYESVVGWKNLGRYYDPEQEVWMRATPYYTSVDDAEIITDTNWDHQ